jgi:hypothetical protein
MPHMTPYDIPLQIFTPFSVLDRFQWASTPPVCSGQLPAPFMWPPTLGPRQFDRYPSLSALCFGDPKTYSDEPLVSSDIQAAAELSLHLGSSRSHLPQSLRCRCPDHLSSNQRLMCFAPASWLITDIQPAPDLEPIRAARYRFLEAMVRRLIRHCEDHCICNGPGESRPPSSDDLEVDAWRKRRIAEWERARNEAALEDPNACGEGEDCLNNGGLTVDHKTQCGQSCNGYSDCAEVRARSECEDEVACEFKESTSDIFRKIGICVGIGAFMGLRPGKERLGLLGGRGEDDMMCVCNSTFVSKACCFQQDGVVWNTGGQAGLV